MGTRNETIVVKGGEMRVIQYGQWDGYPSGQGVDALKILHSICASDITLAKFAAKVDAVHELTEPEIDALNGTDWRASHPQLSRDNGATILQIINGQPAGLPLQLDRGGLRNTLMIEYAYVVDLDKGTFEVYRNGAKSPIPDNERFAIGNADPYVSHAGDKYWPLKHVRTWSLTTLPTEDDFVRECNADDPE